MSTQVPGQPVPLTNRERTKFFLRNSIYILAALLIFLFALDLMISSLQHLGKTAAETIILATSNPFTGLFIGLLVTAIIQSSSTTTSMTVALVASGAITLEGAIPIIMGANVGTTITSTIVSLGFITKKKEFRRAVATGTYHDFFNILTVIILFPLEYYYGFLSTASQFIATRFFGEPMGPLTTDFTLLSVFKPVIHLLVTTIDQGFILMILAFGLLFGSILFFRKVLSDLLGFGTQGRVQQFFFQNTFKSFGWGL
ncbi:MAG: phosphate transporter, partial [Cytophaga sp.]|nr:phosphate transporter [Cytophaga sp.]